MTVKQGSKHFEPFVDYFCGFRSELYGAFYEMTGGPNHKGRTTQDTGTLFVRVQHTSDNTNKQTAVGPAAGVRYE